LDAQALAALVSGEACIDSLAPAALWAAVFPSNATPDDVASTAATEMHAHSELPLPARKRLRESTPQGGYNRCCSTDRGSPHRRCRNLHPGSPQGSPQGLLRAAPRASRGKSPNPAPVGTCSVSSGPDPLDTLYLEAMAGVGVSVGVGTDEWGDADDDAWWRASDPQLRPQTHGATSKPGVSTGTDPIEFDSVDFLA
jgi:hypothetical protein